MSASVGQGLIGEWRRVSPLTVVEKLAKAALQGIIPAVAIMFGSAGSSGRIGEIALYIIPIVFLIIAATLASAWLGWVRLRYCVGENDVRLEQGIISRAARSVPYDRIQDVSLEQKLIPRLFGLVEVRFETGAGGKEELRLAYVSEAEGERLRETVRAMAEGAEAGTAVAQAAADAGDTGDAAAVRTLFTMAPGRLFTFGLFEFSLVIFAVLIGAAQQFEFLLPFDLWDYVESWFADEGYSEAGAYVTGMGVGAQIVAFAYALFTLIVVGIASGVVRTALRDWDFRLERTTKGFRRRRGLLTKTDVVMPVHRVQALVLSTGWLRRRFGWHGLSFISLAQDAGTANHDVAPFAKLEEIAPIAEEAGFALPGEAADWRKPSANFRFDRALLQILLLVPVAVALAIVLPSIWPAMLVIALAAFLALRQLFLLRFERHALGERQVMGRTGWLAPTTRIANRVKLHSVEIAQGPLGRWRGYCDLHFGLGGGRLAFHGLALEDARKLRAAMLDSIAAVDFSALPR